ncbi:hypothetical protein BJ170DRAFT_678326 [Xylariales sp. AK1849]|nr:hypothetical protein BJ170DRAFT_678326 [Xylariales sp. AK1849]
MTAFATPLPITATASIVASAWASGAGAAISFFTITPILASDASRDTLLQQWQLAFTRGKTYMPPVAVAITASYCYVAYTHWKQDLEWRGFAAAGALTVGIVPFTLFFIRGNIGQIQDAMLRKGSIEEARALLTTWGALNLARAMLPLVGSAAALWNLLV